MHCRMHRRNFQTSWESENHAARRHDAVRDGGADPEARIGPVKRDGQTSTEADRAPRCGVSHIPAGGARLRVRLTHRRLSGSECVAPSTRSACEPQWPKTFSGIRAHKCLNQPLHTPLGRQSPAPTGTGQFVLPSDGPGDRSRTDVRYVSSPVGRKAKSLLVEPANQGPRRFRGLSRPPFSPG
jgi:hypothetical protein